MIEAIKVNPNSLSRDLDLPVEKVEAVVALLEEGYSAPFILRYRKDQTALLDEDQIVKIAVAYEKQRKFADRKYSYLKTLESQQKLTPELEKLIIETRSPHRLDDVYLPFKSKSEPIPQAARAKGLEPLAQASLTAADDSVALEELAAPYVAADKGVASVQDALQGAADIIAEEFSEVFDLRQSVRGFILHSARVVSKRAAEPAAEPVATPEPAATSEPATAPEPTATPEPVAATSETPASSEETAPADPVPPVVEAKDEKKKSDDSRSQQLDRLYADYYDATFELRRLTRDQIQTLNRGVSSRVLDVQLQLDHDKLVELAKETLLPQGRAYAEYLTPIVNVALDSYLVPSLELETRRELVDGALEQALDNVCASLYNKLMQRPIPNRRVLAVDCAYRNTCKVVALDENGAFLEADSICLRGSEERVSASAEKLVELVNKHNLSVFALRSGSGRIKTVDSFFAKLITEKFADKDVVYIDVNDAGLDSYAASALAQEELPEHDTLTRCALSLGRRLINPLSEYVKVAPEYLCDDPFCRKLRLKTLRDVLGKVVARAVNSVGVDVNAASEATLSFVVGLTPLSVKNLVEFRKANGPFRSREQFKEVDGISDATFAQCAGFMRVVDGDNPLDATWIHPESYATATAVLEKFGMTVEDLRVADKRAELGEKTKSANLKELATELGVGPRLLADIVAELVTPGRDVRESREFPIFKRSLVKLEDLKPGMELTGVVSRVVEYGAFIDFGATTSGMAHVSRLSASHVRDARQVVSVGQTLKVWIVDVDLARNRVGLSAVAPCAANDRRPRRDGERRFTRGDSESAERRERRPRRPRGDGDRDRERSESGGEVRRERGERSERGPRRNDRNRDNRDRAPRNAQVVPKAKEVKPLSEEKKSGKESLQSFGELKQFFGL